MSEYFKHSSYIIEGVETPSKRGQYRNNRRPEVMEAAMRLFVQNGYDAVTYDMIAQEASIAKSAINKLFGGKETLARLCVRYFIEQFVSEMAEGIDAEAGYAAQVRRTAQLMKAHRAEWRFLVALLATPKNVPMAAEIWTETYAEKINMMHVYKDEVGEENFDAVLHASFGLHLSYIIGGNEEIYDQAIALHISMLEQKMQSRRAS